MYSVRVDSDAARRVEMGLLYDYLLGTKEKCKHAGIIRMLKDWLNEVFGGCCGIVLERLFITLSIDGCDALPFRAAIIYEI